METNCVDSSLLYGIKLRIGEISSKIESVIDDSLNINEVLRF